MKGKIYSIVLLFILVGNYLYGQEYKTKTSGYYNGTGSNGIQYVQFGLNVRMFKYGDMLLIGWNPVDVQIGDEYVYKGKKYSASQFPEIKQIRVKSMTGQLTASDNVGRIIDSKGAQINVGGYLDNSGALGDNNKIFKEGVTTEWFEKNILQKSVQSPQLEVVINSVYIDNFDAANAAIERFLKGGSDKKKAAEVALEADRALSAEDVALASAKIGLMEQLDPSNSSLANLKNRLASLVENKKRKEAEDKKKAEDEKDKEEDKPEDAKKEEVKKEEKKKEEEKPMSVSEYDARLRYNIVTNYNQIVGGAYNVGGSQFGASKEKMVQGLISSSAEYLQRNPYDQEIRNIKQYLENNETTAAVVTQAVSVAQDFIADFAFQLEYNFSPKKEGETSAFRQYYVTIPMSKDAIDDLFQFTTALTWSFLPSRSYEMEYVKSGNEAGEFKYKDDVKVATVGFRFALYPRLYKGLHANIETDIHGGVIMSSFDEEINPSGFTYYLAGKLGLSYRLGKGFQLGIGYGMGYMPLYATSDTQVINDVEYQITKFRNGKDATLKYISPSIKFYF